jgi:hypothetical protein
LNAAKLWRSRNQKKVLNYRLLTWNLLL